MSHERTPEDDALLGLTSLRPGHSFQLPDKVLDENGVAQQAARALDAGAIDALLSKGLVQRAQRWNSFVPTAAGIRRMAEIVLLETKMEPIGALSALAMFSGGVMIQKAERNKFFVKVLQGATMFVATHEDLAQAILDVKAQMDRAILGS